jgi:hypothetical protein
VIKAVAPIFTMLLPIRTMPMALSISSRILKLLSAPLLPFIESVSMGILLEDTIAVSTPEKNAEKKVKNIIIR